LILSNIIQSLEVKNTTHFKDDSKIIYFYNNVIDMSLRSITVSFLKIKILLLHYYCKNKGIIPINLLHIGKTGGTAIKHTIKKIAKNNNSVFYLHPHEIKLKNIPKNGKVIFFLRDPVARFVSAFNSRKRQGRPRYFYPWSSFEKIAFRNFKTANELALALSVNHRKNEKAIFAMKHIQHVNNFYIDWFKNWDYFLLRIDSILFIGFQESLKENFAELKMKLCLPNNLELPNDTILSHRSPTNSINKLDREAVLNLKQWYKKDIEFINFCKELKKSKNL